jgi:hypothetical protein
MGKVWRCDAAHVSSVTYLDGRACTPRIRLRLCQMGVGYERKKKISRECAG